MSVNLIVYFSYHIKNKRFVNDIFLLITIIKNKYKILFYRLI